MKINLFIDMDGTLVEWRSATLQELLTPGFFLGGRAYENVVRAVLRLAKNGSEIAVSTLSAYLEESNTALQEKNLWLDGIQFPASNRYFVPIGGTVGKRDAKVAYVENKLGRALAQTDVLLDDYSVNLHAWAEAGGTAVKLMNGVNGSKGTWQGPKISRFSEATVIATELERIAHQAIAA